MQSSEVNKTGLSVCKKNTHYRFKKKKKRESKKFEVCHAPVLVNDTVPSKKKKQNKSGLLFHVLSQNSLVLLQ